MRVYYAPIASASGARWQRVLAGAYTDDAMARADADRLKAAVPTIDAQVMAAATDAHEPAITVRRAGMSP